MQPLFSAAWMEALAAAWNADGKMLENLTENSFDAEIGFGFIGDDRPTGYLKISGGAVVVAGLHGHQTLDWDLRASRENWQLWLTEGFGLKRLGFTTTTGKLRFVKGNYRQMIRNPSMARPFLRVFELMGEVDTDWQAGL